MIRLGPLVKAAVHQGVDHRPGALPRFFQLLQAGQQVGGQGVYIKGAGKDQRPRPGQGLRDLRRDLPGVEAQSYHLYPSGKAALQGVQQDAAGAVLPFGAGVDKYRLHSATSFIPSGEGKNRTSPTAVS